MRPIVLLLFVLLAGPVFAQDSLTAVQALPTSEINDLHVDRKGYLWIGHTLGLSRYDGVNFIHYNHPAQVNLRMSDIVEDRRGRIWFHNASGQVFFIEQNRMQLLASYDYRSEFQTPRMALCGDELLITSYKGLYVYNTISGASTFHLFLKASEALSSSLAVSGNKALIYTRQEWYIYSSGRLKLIRLESKEPLAENDISFLHTGCINDTAFLVCNPSGLLYKLHFDNNRVQLVGRKAYFDYINAVTTTGTGWVHVRNASFALNGNARLPKNDLVDVVTGPDGSTWLGSRREGVLRAFQPQAWSRIVLPLDPNDYVRSLYGNSEYLLVGSQRGTIYKVGTRDGKLLWRHDLFNGFGSIDFVRSIAEDSFVVGSSTNTYIIDARNKLVRDSLPVRSVLDVGIGANSFFIATPQGIYITPQTHVTDRDAWLRELRGRFRSAEWKQDNHGAYRLFRQRSTSLRYDSVQNAIYAATKNGLYLIDAKGERPFRINGREVYASSVVYKYGRSFIATLNDGLWILEKGTVKHLSRSNSLLSNNIIRIKATEDHLWIFGKEALQLLNIHTDEVLPNVELPKVEGANVLDVSEVADDAYLSTAKGLFKIPLRRGARKPPPVGYLDFVLVNSKDTFSRDGIRLRYDRNDLQFVFSTPATFDAASVGFRYRLVGADEEWKTTAPNERMVRYAALPPGNYRFELYAFSSEGIRQVDTLKWSVQVRKPWWKEWWSLLLLNLLIIGGIYLLLRNRANQRLRLELVRRRISNDLHDDIGATLSSVNFYIHLARQHPGERTHLERISKNVNDVVSRLDDLVWSINPRNDDMEHLLSRMQDHAVPLLHAAGTRCVFDFDAKLLQAKVDPEKKRQLYLLFKELTNNVAKHAQAQNCHIQLALEKRSLVLNIRDDGHGFSENELPKGRSGLASIRERAAQMGGRVEIKSTAGNGTSALVCIPLSSK